MSALAKLLQLGGRPPVMLAPLAGVSDIPFRLVCQALGADLTYVEMLSATALVHRSARTMAMMARGKDEPVLGVQVTGRTPEELGEAVRILDDGPFETIDINMGCPVRKVVQAGCGSAILKDPRRVFATVHAARAATRKPLSAKIRLGWDHHTRNFLEVGRALVDAGVDWITAHGRCRSDDYSVPVDLEALASLQQTVSAAGAPLIGNGNLFGCRDVRTMVAVTGVQGVMVSRGALGNPWIFRELQGGAPPLPDEWAEVVLQHLAWQSQTYGASASAAVRMRKHLLWYLKGWPGGKRLREAVNQLDSVDAAADRIRAFAAELPAVRRRPTFGEQDASGRFHWDPKFEMDRQLDRGVGDDQLVGLAPSS